MNLLRALPPARVDAQALLSPWSEDFREYLRDESKLSGTSALGIAFPKTTEELSALLTHLADKRITISASRTGVTGGALPDPDSFVISLERLKGFISSGSDELTVRAGTTLQELDEFITEHLPGHFFPVDPTERSASIGGAVALNAGGSRSLAFGSVRNWIRGLTVLLASGEILTIRRGDVTAQDGILRLQTLAGERAFTGGTIPKPKTKNTLGYSFSPDTDAVDLFIGSEGTLGVIAEITLAVIPIAPIQLSHFQAFSSSDAALKAIARLRALRPIAPLALEFIDSRSILRVNEKPKPQLQKFLNITTGSEAALFVEAGLHNEDELLEFSEAIFEILATLGEDPSRSVSGTDARTLNEIKAFRHAIPERMNAIIAERRQQFPSLHKLSTDMAVEDEHLEWVYRLYESELAPFEFCIFGHAGNNHFHVNVLPRDLDELARAKDAYLRLADQIVSRGGAVAAEHGIGRLKRPFLEKQYSPEVFQTFRKLKGFFDPELRLNPGVLFLP